MVRKVCSPSLAPSHQHGSGLGREEITTAPIPSSKRSARLLWTRIPHRHTQALGSAAAPEALPLIAMILSAAQIGVLTAELEARGFFAGISKFILVVIIVLVVGGALIGFAVGRRR